MKNRGIKILTAVLVVIMLLSMTTAVLAAGTEGEKAQTLREKGQKLEVLFAEYAPDLLDDYLSLKQEHEAFHQGRKTQHERFKKQTRGGLNTIIDAFVAGEISGEDAIAAIIETRDSLKAYRDELLAIKDAKKAEKDALKTQRESLRLQIQAALKADEVNEALMYSLMEQTLTQLRIHLEMDYKYADQVDAIKAQYFPE